MPKYRPMPVTFNDYLRNWRENYAEDVRWLDEEIPRRESRLVELRRKRAELVGVIRRIDREIAEGDSGNRKGMIN